MHLHVTWLQPHTFQEQVYLRLPEALRIKLRLQTQHDMLHSEDLIFQQRGFTIHNGL